MKSWKPTKKYCAILQNKITGRYSHVHFGSSTNEHYRDSTGLKYWKHKDHNDRERLKNYRNRFKRLSLKPYSAHYFSYHYLWS